MQGISGSCGCKGVRSCLVCQPHIKVIENKLTNYDEYVYCDLCNKAWPKQNEQSDDSTNTNMIATSECIKPKQIDETCQHTGNALEFPGVYVQTDFISEAEEQALVEAIDESTWKPSQSGRFKQDYGPRANFKKRKLKCTGFTGLPPFSEALINKLVSVPILTDFKPVEQCHLEYLPDRGSSIDPHIDDTWLWGERLVTVNLLSDLYLLMTPLETNDEMINKEKVRHEGVDHDATELTRTKSVKINMPRWSLLVLYGDARYKWEHSIPRGAVQSRRIAITFRELTPEFSEGGHQGELGESILKIALSYKGSVIG